jgi:hypothetical protein
MNLHPLYNRTELAYWYYKLKYPDRNYDREQARKQLAQDNDLDEKVLLQVLRGIYQKQKLML